MRSLHRLLMPLERPRPVLRPRCLLVAQAPGSGTVLHVSPYAGYMVFGNYLNGPLGTTLSNAPGMLYGTQVGLSLAPNLSLVGNIGYTASDIEVGIPFLGGISVGQQLDADLRRRTRVRPRLDRSRSVAAFTPFVQAGRRRDAVRHQRIDS